MCSVMVKTTCPVCPNHCRLFEGQIGHCQARENVEGAIVASSYGRVTGLALDPIEKKPLARFMPGTQVLSLGSYGCSMACPWCQNAHLADAGKGDVPWIVTTPQRLVNRAAQLSADNCVGLAYTYNEPLINWEFVRDCAKLAHDRNLVNVLVSNGMATPEIWEELLPYLDAVNLDLKCFTEEGYATLRGDLRTVTDSIQLLAKTPTCHLEVTWLVVPGFSDDPRYLGAAALWLSSLDPDITLHVTRFFPCHHMTDAEATPVETVHNLAEVARQHLAHVFVGNC